MVLGAALSVTEGEPECEVLGSIHDSVDGDSDPVVLVTIVGTVVGPSVGLMVVGSRVVGAVVSVVSSTSSHCGPNNVHAGQPSPFWLPLLD